MIKTIIQLKKEISEQHYHDKGKPVYLFVAGVRYQIASVNEYDDEVLIEGVAAEDRPEDVVE